MPGKESEELVEKIYTELEEEILDINFSEIKVTIFGQEVTLVFVGMRIYEIISEDRTLNWEETEIPLRLNSSWKRN